MNIYGYARISTDAKSVDGRLSSFAPPVPKRRFGKL